MVVCRRPLWWAVDRRLVAGLMRVVSGGWGVRGAGWCWVGAGWWVGWVRGCLYGSVCLGVDPGVVAVRVSDRVPLGSQGRPWAAAWWRRVWAGSGPMPLTYGR